MDTEFSEAFKLLTKGYAIMSLKSLVMYKLIKEEGKNIGIKIDDKEYTHSLESCPFVLEDMLGRWKVIGYISPEDKMKQSLELVKNLKPIEVEVEPNGKANTKASGWVSIEDELPQCLAKDYITKGYSTYRVKNNFNIEFDSRVTDHNVWYHYAKNSGITHWWKEN